MKIFTNKKLIIFDLDGTLVDSVPDLALGVNIMLTTLGRKTFEEAVIRSWVGNGAQTLVKRALSGSALIDENLDKVLFEEALSVFLKAYKENLCVKTVLYPEVLSTLKTLKERGFILALVTNKPFEFIAPLLEGLGMRECFELCLGGDSLAVKKPDPLPLLHVCEKLGFSVEASIMVGDSKNDILAANSAKMQSIGVTYGYNYGEDIGVYSPDSVVNNFAEIRELLEMS